MCQRDSESFALSREDTQDKDQWELRIKGNWLTRVLLGVEYICVGECLP